MQTREGPRGRNVRVALHACRISGCPSTAREEGGLCHDCEAELRWLQGVGARVARVRDRRATAAGRRVRPSARLVAMACRGLLRACVELLAICVVLAVIWVAVVLLAGLGMGIGGALR